VRRPARLQERYPRSAAAQTQPDRTLRVGSMSARQSLVKPGRGSVLGAFAAGACLPMPSVVPAAEQQGHKELPYKRPPGMHMQKHAP